ncbi:uncharacterized protein LOC108939998 [Arapaima gigas]
MAVTLQLLSLLLLGTSCIAVTTLENVKILRVKKGQPMSLQCSTNQEDFMSMELQWRMETETRVLYFYQASRKMTLGEQYSERVKWEGEMTKLSVTIYNATADDSGIYWCVYNKVNNQTRSVDKIPGKGSILVVVDGDVKPCPPAEPLLSTNLLIAAGVSAGSVLLLCTILLFICLSSRVQKFSERKNCRNNPEFVYEDMGKTLRTTH